MKIHWAKLAICIAIPLALGGIAGFFTQSNISTWYDSLNTPWFNPPGWIFGPVWTLLYILMGIASYIIWMKPKSQDRNSALGVYGVQLVFNFLWSFIFFEWHEIGWAFAEIILLWLLINLTIIQFSKISKPAAYLLLPYIAWVSFAAILNYNIWMLN